MRRSLFVCAVLPLSVALAACGNKGVSGFDDAGTADDDGGTENPLDDGSVFDPGDASGDVQVCGQDPSNFDVPGNNCDDDGDGKVDNEPVCDTNLPENGDAFAFGKAIGLCNKQSGGGWGVVSAAYTQGYNNVTPPKDEQHGILKKFGNVVKPRQGGALGVLSSGWAREYDQCYTPQGVFQGGCSMTGVGAAPAGFPKAAQGCPIDTEVNDVATISLKIKVPANAKGLKFDFNFFSGEWPQWVCTNFNDSFIAYLKSAAFNNGVADNISFDVKKNPVSVNNAFFDRCSPKNLACSGKPVQPCAGGDAELQGTGFYDPSPHCDFNTTDSGGGGTGWLTTQAPVKPGETITLEFYVFDVGDQAYDSSVLIDKVEWLATDTTTGTVRPPN